VCAYDDEYDEYDDDDDDNDNNNNSRNKSRMYGNHIVESTSVN
jgi:hypothetical protein